MPAQQCQRIQGTDQYCNRQGQDDDQGAPEVEQEGEDHQRDDDRFFGEGVLQGVDGPGDEVGAVVEDLDVAPRRQRRPDRLYASVDALWTICWAVIVGAILGYLLAQNLWLSAGFNFTGFSATRDLAGGEYTNRGAYLRLRFKFDEHLFASDDPVVNRSLDR